MKKRGNCKHLEDILLFLSGRLSMPDVILGTFSCVFAFSRGKLEPPADVKIILGEMFSRLSDLL